MTYAPSAAHRYVVGFAPNPGSFGWLAGSHWLGRCAALLQPLQQPEVEGVAAGDLHRLTAAPRLRGWHAPLTTPFALAPGADWITLHHTVQAIAHRLVPCKLPPLRVERVGDFLALVSASSAHPAHAAMHHAAAACAAQLHPLRALHSAADRTGERAPGAAAPGMEDFRFHLPITGPLSQVEAATQARVLDAAQEFFSDLPVLTFNSLALFAEPTPGADFVLLDHLEMGL